MPVILCNCPSPVPSGTADGQVPIWDETTQSWIPGITPAPDCCPPDGTVTGDTLVWDGSEWVAQQPSGGIDSGTSFPASPNAGDIFYRNDLMETAYYDGTRWVGDIITIPMTNLGSLAHKMTSSENLYATPTATDDLLLVSWDVTLWLKTPANASNYWKYYLFERHPGGGTTRIVAVNRTTADTDWQRVSHQLSYVLSSSSASILRVDVEKTGSPGSFTFSSTLYARRILT